MGDMEQRTDGTSRWRELLWMTMLDFLRRINKIIDRVSDFTAKGVSYLIFVLMLLIPFEVRNA